MHRKYSLYDIQVLAAAKGGHCLSSSYSGIKAKLDWQCSERHTWQATPDSVIQGAWCPICAVERRSLARRTHSIAELRAIAQSRGGDCLSEEYLGVHVPLKWVCSNAHVWEAEPNRVVNAGHWCLICAGKAPYSIEDMRVLANARGGECLSTEYHGANTRLRWRCSLGHEWQATPSSIKNLGTWCPTCGLSTVAGKVRKYTLGDMQELAAKRGGSCLSERFVSVNSKLHWRCSEGHEWAANPAGIMRGRWCPTCASYMSERVCRQVFELLFGCEFPKSRPKWLRIGKRRALELDGYAAGLSLAFEYQGHQHFKKVGHFEHNLEQRRHYDKVKRELCDAQGVRLIEVPYWIERPALEAFVRAQCQARGIPVPRQEPIGEEELREAFLTDSKELAGLRKLASEKGGRLLSERYEGALTKLRWQCSAGHRWMATPNAVRNSGTWCAICVGNVLDTIEAMRQLAADHGGQCLSADYTNQVTPLRWRCAKGHEWEAIPRNLRNRGTWCPYCSGRRLWAPESTEEEARLEELRKVAEERGGACLSMSYLHIDAKIPWRCASGHLWEASPSNIKKGGWCPYCSGRKVWAPGSTEAEARLAELQAIAAARGGTCLAASYVRSSDKVRWRCASGHEWEAKVSHVVHIGSWCPVCAARPRRKPT